MLDLKSNEIWASNEQRKNFANGFSFAKYQLVARLRASEQINIGLYKSNEEAKN